MKSGKGLLFIALIGLLALLFVVLAQPATHNEAAAPIAQEGALYPGDDVPLPMKKCEDKSLPTFAFTGHAQREFHVGSDGIYVLRQIEFVINDQTTVWVDDGHELILPYCDGQYAVGVVHTNIAVFGPWGDENPTISLYQYGVGPK